MSGEQQTELQSSKGAQDEAFKDIWSDDLLDRQQDAHFLTRFLTHRIEERGKVGLTKSYVLNLDAQWGQGKTFFLDRFKRQLEAEGYLVAYVNAWEDDFADDPLVAVIAAIDQLIQSNFKLRSNWNAFWTTAKRSTAQITAAAVKGGAKRLGSKLIGEGYDNISELIDEDTLDDASVDNDQPSDIQKGVENEFEKLLDRQAEILLQNFKKTKSSIVRFRSSLASLLTGINSDNERSLPLFVLVDELDRCRPTYALKLLERVKHLFEVDNVVFVVATDSVQLRSAIKAVYGSEFDSTRYLLRFFDRTYVFEQPTFEQFIDYQLRPENIDQSILSSPPADNHKTFFVGMMNGLKLSLRDMEQCFDMLSGIATVWPYPVKIQLVYMMPLIFAFQQGNSDLFAALEERKHDTTKSLLPQTHHIWNAEYHRVPQPRRQSGLITHTVAQHLGDIFPMMNRPISNAMRDLSGNVRTEPKIWLCDQLADEFSEIHSNKETREITVMNLYPQLVRNVGRLVLTLDSKQKSKQKHE